MRREMKTIKHITLDIAQNAKNGSVMSRSRCTHKLTHQMNSIGNIRSCNRKIDETAD
jgi:hypothetical protein